MKKLTLLSLFVVPVFLFSQNVQWASKVIDFSSEYSDKTYSAVQALGVPSVWPSPADNPCVWSSEDPDGEIEFLKVGFENEMRISQVAIFQSLRPGAIFKVEVFGSNNQKAIVFETDYPDSASHESIFQIQGIDLDFKVNAVKLWLNTEWRYGWSHIDAIAISDSEEMVDPDVYRMKEGFFPTEARNMGKVINSRHDEIMPVISPNGDSLFFDRKDHPFNTGDQINDDIWVAVRSQTGVWKKAKNVGRPLNNFGHNFAFGMTRNGNRILLGNVYEPDGNMSAGVSYADRKADGWKNPRRLKIADYYNENKYSEFFISNDEETIVLAVERKDTRGNKDLYVSFKEKSGKYSEPINMGDGINTASTEMSPFLGYNERLLFFSSGGRISHGGYDLYVSYRIDDTWTNWTDAVNLGPLLNSESWDAYFMYPKTQEYAFISSDRKGSMGKTDLYILRLPENFEEELVRVLKEVSGLDQD